jgi:hypothetical protein
MQVDDHHHHQQQQHVSLNLTADIFCMNISFGCSPGRHQGRCSEHGSEPNGSKNGRHSFDFVSVLLAFKDFAP